MLNPKFSVSFIFILFVVNSFSKEILVTNNGDAGLGSLRNALETEAVNGDTININVKGLITLQSAINVSGLQDIIVIGPYAKHLQINAGNTFTGTSLFHITTSQNITFSNLGFVNSVNTLVRIFNIDNNTGPILIDRCLFKDIVFSGATDALITVSSSDLRIKNCSFIQNQGNQGGVLNVDVSTVLVENSTFWDNTAVNGGAIFVDNNSSVILRHASFYENNASGSGDAVQSNSASNTITLHNCAAGNNGLAADAQFNGAGNFASSGGNRIKSNAGDALAWLTSSNDLASTVLILGLRATILEDGFGMWYFPIVDPSSQLINSGVAPFLPTSDCRGAPRSLQPTSVAAVAPDAGACEYTFLRVTSAGNATTPGMLPWALASLQNFNTVNFIEFDIPGGPFTIEPTTGNPLVLAGNYIIDGFSQPGSAIPGPDITGGFGVTPAVLPIVIKNTSTVTQGISVGAVSTNSTIRGIRVINFTQRGISLAGSNTKILGCEIGIDEFNVAQPNNHAGVFIQGSSNIIGGKFHWQRNIISGNGTSVTQANVNIESGAINNQILGNIIGLSANGNTIITGANATYALFVSGNGTIVGNAGFGNGNTIGRCNYGIFCLGGNDLKIRGNKIGVAYNGLNQMVNTISGIWLDGSGINSTIGSVAPFGRNIISGNGSYNLRINNYSNVTVVNNLIGPDATGNSPCGATTYGIYLNHASANNIALGGNPGNIGNVISGNANGIYVSVSGTNTTIYNNIIGLNADGNAPLSNGNYGISVENTTTNILQIGTGGGGNVISGQSGVSDYGIIVRGNIPHVIDGNIIGLNKTGDAAIPNEIGVYLFEASNVQIGTAVGNVISGNSGDGILIEASGSGNKILFNKIGTNVSGFGGITNGVCGIRILNTNGTVIGQTSVDKNIISGFSAVNSAGIILASAGTGTVIQANYIGLDISGSSVLPNYDGIRIEGTHAAIIGGTNGTRENYIAGNSQNGIKVLSPNVTIDGNFIGLALGGLGGVGNLNGVLVEAKKTIIGLNNINFIAGNIQHGIFINGENSDSILIDRNIIGTNSVNALGIGNGGDGIRITNGDANKIGTSFPNTIIGNTGAGIHLTGTANKNVILNNTVADFSNTGLTNAIGVYLLNGPKLNEIGGVYSSQKNTIGNNLQEGIRIENADSNLVLGNAIGNNGISIVLPNQIGIRVLASDETIIGDENAGGNGKFNVVGGNLGAGIIIDNSENTVIRGNNIGLNFDGSMILPNTNGIEMINGATANTVGGIGNTFHRNTISGNTGNGVFIQAPSNTVMFNYIGTTPDGAIAAGLQDFGIRLGTGAINCAIGGDRSTEGNLITGNLQAGIVIEEENNFVLGNILGYSSTNTPIGAQNVGILITGANAVQNQIGELPSGGLQFGNIILNHPGAGIRINNAASENSIYSNFIGVEPSDASSFTQNIGVEIQIDAGPDNQIGLDVIDGHNVISGNVKGIEISSSESIIYNNRIGTGSSGLTGIPNSSTGITILNSELNIIGGAGLKGNIISGHSVEGILIDGPGATQNTVSGNIIGSGPGLLSAVSNAIGIRIAGGATDNSIGLPGAGLGNTIVGNDVAGIVISGSSANEVFNNKIGLPIKNTHGLVIQNGSSGNIIGGTSAERNIISNNDSIGIAVNASSGNFISGNFIGTNENGNLPAPNLIGVFINGSDLNEIGNQNHFNLISSNDLAAVVLENSSSNTLKNNFIGTDLTGDAVFAGSENGSGIVLKNSNSNVIGGNNSIDEENVICNNATKGIYLENSDLNEIYGNHIGINKSGTNYLPNAEEGILFRLGSDNNIVGNSGTGLANSIGGNLKGIGLKNSNSNLITSNFIGNDLSGTSVLPGVNNQVIGIHLDSTSSLNSISGLNIISGNLSHGVLISGAGTKENHIHGNYIGVDVSGNTSLPNGITNVSMVDSTSLNLIGGSTLIERNYLGGDVQFQVVINDGCDSNQVAGNYIGLGFDANTTYDSDAGVVILANSRFNVIGGGFAGEGNTIVGFNFDGIRINDANNTKILGNRIGIKPDNSVGTIDSCGVRLEGADYTWIGSYLVGSDSMNVITNCNTGVAVTTIPASFPFLANSSYANVIGGNSIYNNINQGIDLLGDHLVMPIDTNNATTIDNGGIDRPEIVSAWTCGIDGFTHVGFKFYASNAIAGYHVEFYRNPVPDASGFGEGEIYLGDFVFNPATNYDTISINLGQTLPAGTVLTATITGVFGNTSEFSEQYVVTDVPLIGSPVLTDETCLGAGNGTASVIADDAYTFSWDGGLSWINGNGSITSTLPSGSHALEALYLNGCSQTINLIMNQGLPLVFDFNIIPDTCGLGVGEIIIDTVSTTAAGGSGNYIYTFNGGSFYNGTIDTIGVLAGIYNIGLNDTSLGCFSLIDAIVVDEITDVVDESFVFDDFCSTATPIPSSTATSGGVFSFGTAPGDGALIDSNTGLISGPTPGNSYEVVYTVGICFEAATITVNALLNDDSTFTFADFCDGANQVITVTGLSGGVFSLDPDPLDGTTINSSTGELADYGISTYSIKYTTNGPCPTSLTQTVEVLFQPAPPTIIATDSIYCPGEVLQTLSLTGGASSINWFVGSTTTPPAGTAANFTPVILQTGNNYIFAQLIDVSGCGSLPDSINYYLSDTSLMRAIDDFSTCQGSRAELNAIGGVAYQWTPNDAIADLSIANPTVSVMMEDTYSVTIIDVFGCIVVDSVTVSLLPLSECHVDVYNAFSPNDDGINDYWIIDGIEGYPENLVTIFTRWGDVLVRLENYNNVDVIWDGKNKYGREVESGTYYYVVNVRGEQNQSGWIQVVK